MASMTTKMPRNRSARQISSASLYTRAVDFGKRIFRRRAAFTVNVAREIARRSRNVTYSAYKFSKLAQEIQAPTGNLEGVFIPAVESAQADGLGINILSGLSSCLDAVKKLGGNRVVVLIKNGKEKQDTSPSLMLRPSLIAANVSIVTVGVGSDIFNDTLSSLASRPRLLHPFPGYQPCHQRSPCCKRFLQSCHRPFS